MNNPTVQAMLERSRHIKLSILIMSHEYYEIPKRNIQAKWKIYHIFQPKIFKDVQNLYQHKHPWIGHLMKSKT